MPTGAQIVAAADTFDELSARAEGEHIPDIIALLQRDVGYGFSLEVLRALEATLGKGGGVHKTRSNDAPAGLTSREIEVLRLISKGFNNREAAGKLFVSETTVRHHLEHIYDKIGVSSRAAAVMFALEHELLPSHAD